MNESTIQTAMESADPATAEQAFREIDTQLRSSADARERADLLLRKGVLYGVLRRFGDARKQLDLALEEAPDDPATRLEFDFISGGLYDQEGAVDEAFERLSALLSTHAEQLKAA